jgi:hypothetical protein
MLLFTSFCPTHACTTPAAAASTLIYQKNYVDGNSAHTSFGKYLNSASSGAESMNNANDLARQKAAVDILNAAIKIIQLDGDRFAWWKQQAWNRDQS